MSSLILLKSLLEPRLDPPAFAWVESASAEISGGASDLRFGTLLSLAARQLGFLARQVWQLNDAEVNSSGTLIDGWNPERWTPLEAARVVLVLSRPDLMDDSGPAAIEAAFRFADEGELCALYRSLAHLPQPDRFVWRAAEGCRTNMVTVFEAGVCDTPFPGLHFDDVAFNQAAIKAVFIGAPLWRLWNLDRRISAELARMALDLIDERRSAHRAIQVDLWMCLGTFGGARGLAAIEAELTPHLGGPLASSDADIYPKASACAAVLALGRAGQSERLHQLETSAPAFLASEATCALTGGAGQSAWASFDPREQKADLKDPQPTNSV